MMSIPPVTSIGFPIPLTAAQDIGPAVAPVAVVRPVTEEDAVDLSAQYSANQQQSHEAAAQAARQQAAQQAAQDGSASDAMQALRDFAAASQLQVKFVDLPDGPTPIYRLVKPETGEVVREFPPEELTRILASLRENSRVDARA